MRLLKNKKYLLVTAVPLGLLAICLENIIFTNTAFAAKPWQGTVQNGRHWVVVKDKFSSSPAAGHTFPISGGDVTLKYESTVTAAPAGTGSVTGLFWFNMDMTPGQGAVTANSASGVPGGIDSSSQFADSGKGCLAGRDVSNVSPPIQRYNCNEKGAAVWATKNFKVNQPNGRYTQNMEITIHFNPNQTSKDQNICGTMHIGEYSSDGMNVFGNRPPGKSIKDIIAWQSNNADEPNKEDYDQPTYSVSENVCFTIPANKTPTGTLEFDGDCRYRVKGSDRDSPNAYLAYKILRQNESGNGFVQQVPEVPVMEVKGDDSDGTGWVRPVSPIMPNRSYVLKLRDVNTSEWFTVPNQPVSVGNCDGPIRDDGQLGACGITVHFRVPDEGVKVKVYALKSNWSAGKDPFSSTYSSVVYDRNHHRTGEVSLANDPDIGLRELLSNNGFWVLVKPLNASTTGDDNDTTGGDTEEGSGGDHRSYYTGQCFDVRCEGISISRDVPLSAEAGWPANAVKAGSEYVARITLKNYTKNPFSGSGVPVPRYLDEKGRNYPLGLTDLSGSALNGNRPLGREMQPNESVPFDVELTAPSTIGTVNHDGYPDFWNKFPIGAGCRTYKVDVYQRYDFTATATSGLDDIEKPTVATFNSGVVQDASAGPFGAARVGVDSKVTRTFFKRAPDGSRTPLAGVSTPTANPDIRDFVSRSYSDDTYNISLGSYVTGDGYCVFIVLDRGKGWRGPSAYQNEGTAEANNCGVGGSPPPQPVVSRPYFRTYGADTVAGGGFGSNCAVGDAKIAAFTRPLIKQNSIDKEGGSGSQLAAMALGNISGFTSASTRSTNPLLPIGLSFANTVNNSGNRDAGPDTMQPNTGGGMLNNGWCAPDYFTKTQYPEGSPFKNTTSNNANPLNIMTLDDKKQSQFVIPGQVKKLKSSNASNYRKHHAIYVEGDVYIEDNIKYDTTFTGSIDSIPSFALVVKGNIYVDRKVTQLDGLYIAQPKADGTKGKIYTCADNSGAPITDATVLFNECGGNIQYVGNDRVACNIQSGEPRQLTVNGAFVAQRVVLNRAGYTVGCAKFQEQANTSKAAEIFKFSPEMYLSPPFFSPRSTATSGDYQYITTLPPIL
jgi:hypothetical protein